AAGALDNAPAATEGVVGPATDGSPIVAITRFPRVDAADGVRRRCTWRELCDSFAKPCTTARRKEELPLWSPATFSGDHREAKGVELVYALGFDDDVSPRPWDETVALWAGLGVLGLVHTTARH